jgi:quercetin dioxygenase-like cupin family protein
MPDSLDALDAAPQHHRLLLENDQIRVLEALIPPGERTAVHTHSWPAVQYITSFSHFIRRDAAGNIIHDSRSQEPLPEGTAIWSEPLTPHSAENVGETPLRVIVVELKTHLQRFLA